MEELSSPLKTSLLAWKKHAPEYCVYEVSRKTFYLGAWIEHSGWYPDFQRRLYRRDEAEFFGTVHESLRHAGKIGRLSGDLLHYTVRSLKSTKPTLSATQHWGAANVCPGKRTGKARCGLPRRGAVFQNFVLRGGFMEPATATRSSRKWPRAPYVSIAKLESSSAPRRNGSHEAHSEGAARRLGDRVARGTEPSIIAGSGSARSRHTSRVGYGQRFRVGVRAGGRPVSRCIRPRALFPRSCRAEDSVGCWRSQPL